MKKSFFVARCVLDLGRHGHFSKSTMSFGGEMVTGSVVYFAVDDFLIDIEIVAVVEKCDEKIIFGKISRCLQHRTFKLHVVTTWKREFNEEYKLIFGDSVAA